MTSTKMTVDEFTTEFDKFCQYFGVLPNPMQVKVWYKVLKKYTVKQINEGFDAYFEQSIYRGMPMPGSIVKAIDGKFDPMVPNV